VHPVGSYCTDISRCAVNKTLKIKRKIISYRAGNLNFCHLVAKHERRNVIVPRIVCRLLYVDSVCRTLIHACNTNTSSNSNVKFNLWHAMKAQTGNSGIVLFVKPGNRSGWWRRWWTMLNSVALLPGRRRRASHCTGGWEFKCILHLMYWCTETKFTLLYCFQFVVGIKLYLAKGTWLAAEET